MMSWQVYICITKYSILDLMRYEHMVSTHFTLLINDIVEW